MLEGARKAPPPAWPKAVLLAAIAFGAGYLLRGGADSTVGASMNECVMRNVKGAATEFEAKAMYQMCTDRFSSK